MILRVIRGRGDSGRVAALQADLASRFPDPGRSGDPARYRVGVRPGSPTGGLEVLVLVFWHQHADLAAADERHASVLSVARDIGIDELSTAHFEIDATIREPGVGAHVAARPTTSEAAIRLATGSFSRQGADIEMQEMLRERAPQLGDEMTEAYVGRRMVGRSVDVTFISCWSRVPPDRNLQDPFWPDIALRYDAFSVEVFGALANAAEE